MKAVQILMDEDLIGAVDREAKRMKLDRSKLIRVALARFLVDANTAVMEQRQIDGYRKHPQRKSEIQEWERIQAWPEE